ncbi:glycosyltransferase 87 family protein [Rhodococcus sp. MEB064]|uniref:glycosyltransferase 87 family protein n=1 Tax=Rhodococcus sp. MEB064 TaxID=1587522 RepID=UPI00069607C5|nr:glycosyltransferase 87 family protein [Rhodococcus sp. MEB064]
MILRKSDDRTFGSHRIFVALTVLGAAIAVFAHDRLIPFDVPKFGLFQFGIDALVYRAGGATVLGPEPLYAGNLVGELPFTYPPFAALVFAPLGVMSTTTTHLLFWLGNIVLLYFIVRSCWLFLGFRDDRSLRIVCLSLSVIFTWLEPIRMTIWLGQINLVLLALVLWDLTRPEGSRLRGIGVGIATGIKMTPGLFLIHLALTRQWKALLIGAVTAAVSVVLGFVVLFSDAVTYWFGAISDSSRIGDIGSGANQSLRASIPRWFGFDEAPVLLWVVIAGAVGVAGLLVAAAAHRKGLPLLGLIVCGLTAPLVSPFSWGHHWVWLLPLLIVCMDVALRASNPVAWLLPLLASLPQIAWFWVAPDNVYAIGTFMLPPSNRLEAVALQTVYPTTGVVVIVVVAVILRTCDFRHITKRSRTGDDAVVNTSSPS